MWLNQKKIFVLSALCLMLMASSTTLAVMKHPEKWKPLINKDECVYPAIDLPEAPSHDDILKWALLWENETWNHIWENDPISPVTLNKPAVPGGQPYWPSLVKMNSTERQLKLLSDMIERLETKGIDVDQERSKLAEFQSIYETSKHYANPDAPGPLYMAIRLVKRQLMLRDPDLEPLTKLLFVKRMPYEPTHNYMEIADNNWDGGGSICTLDIPRIDGQLRPADAQVTTLFESADGYPRDPICDYDMEYIYFAHRGPGGFGENHWNLMRMRPDGSELEQLTEGLYNEFYPCPLPDGDIAFLSTQIKCRFLCTSVNVFTLYRMNPKDKEFQLLSYANLSEWAPSMMQDGRILWTRSEYQDKGANFGHTLWTIRPDGTYPELVYGNDTNNGVVNGYEVPGTREFVGIMFSHYGDLNGPVALIDPEQGRFNPDAVTNITPDVGYGYDGRWHAVGNEIAIFPERRCFRDSHPISSDYFLVSHSPAGDWNSPTHLFGLYVIDRYGNRELLYLDPTIGSMYPTPLRKREKPPVVASQLKGYVNAKESLEQGDVKTGEFILSDVYEGLPDSVEPGQIKYLRVCEEIKSDLPVQENGGLQENVYNFLMHYAAPIFRYTGTHTIQEYDVVDTKGRWPTYIAKGVEGIVPVEEDGSARFTAPAGKVLYFQALDENLNEIQRMRSVIQLQLNEKRSCIGCHESRIDAPMNKSVHALTKPAVLPEAPPWGKGPFDYQKVVQPVLDKHCISCHNSNHAMELDLTAKHDSNYVPASYRTLITKSLVDFFNMGWGMHHGPTEAMAFGTLKSKLIKVLEKGHHDVKLSRDEMHAIKCWIDLNCPLWGDYRYRTERTDYPGATVSCADEANTSCPAMCKAVDSCDKKK